MRKFFTSILCYFLSVSFIYAQQFPIPIFHHEIVGDYTYVKADELGNIFALTAGGQLKKFNSNFDSIGVFNDVKRLGIVNHIAFGNALRTVLYFKQYRNIIVLDRLLQVVNKIDLKKHSLFQVEAVAPSYDNKIWIFDEQESKLKKLSEEGSVLFETADLRIVFSEAISPSIVIDNGGFVYLYDPLKGLYIFDYYGGYKRKISLLGWKSIQPLGKNIIGIASDKVFIFTPGDVDIKEMKIPIGLEKAKQLSFMPDGCIALYDDRIVSYKWSN